MAQKHIEAASDDVVHDLTQTTHPDTGATHSDPTSVEADIFSTLSEDDQHHLIQYIAHHPFVVNGGPVVSHAEWDKFIQEVRSTAATAGLSDVAIDRLIAYVRKLYRGVYEDYGGVHYSDGSVFGMETDGGSCDVGHMKQKGRGRRKRGSSVSTKSDSKKAKILPVKDPKGRDEDRSTAALTAESDADRASISSEISKATGAANNTGTQPCVDISKLDGEDVLEATENRENATPVESPKAQKGKRSKKQKTRNRAKVSHHFTKTSTEGKSTLSATLSKTTRSKKNAILKQSQSKPANTGKSTKVENNAEKEAREAAERARSRRKRVRRRERLREKKGRQLLAKEADRQSQTKDSNTDLEKTNSPSNADSLSVQDFQKPMIR